VYAYVHCGEGGLALEMLEKMNAAGFPPAMTVPEVLVKVRARLSSILALATLEVQQIPSFFCYVFNNRRIEASDVEGYYYYDNNNNGNHYLRYLLIESVLVLRYNI